MQVWNVLRAARWKYRVQKSRQKSPSGHHRTSLSGYIFATKAHIDNRNDPVVWGTPANSNRFRDLAALLHGTVVVGVSQTLRRWTEGATYIRQGGHHVGISPNSSSVYFGCSTFLLIGECVLLLCSMYFFHTKPRDWLGERLQNDLFCVEWDVKP